MCDVMQACSLDTAGECDSCRAPSGVVLVVVFRRVVLLVTASFGSAP